MKTTLTLIAIGLFLQTIGQQQTAIFLDAASASGVQQMFYKTSIARNASNDVFTCGATLDNNGNYDILLTKHNSSNVLQWSVTFAGSYGGDDYAADIALDALGNIYVVGTTQVGSLDYNAVMLKFNPSGTQSWAQTYAGLGNGPDGFTTVLVENNNSIYAAGGAYISLSNLTDALSVKYDSTGTSLWTNTWNNSTSSMQDAAVRIVNSGGQTYVFSASQTGNNPVTWKMAQPRYNSTTGAFIAAGISSGDDTAFSTVSDVAVDGVNHILVAGTVQSTTQGKNIRVARFNLTLTEQWVYNYNGAGNTDDEAIALALVGTSHVYVTGYTTSTANGKDLFAAKLVTTSGVVVWDHEMDLATGDDRGAAISLDVAGNAFIATTSYKDGNDDMVVSFLSSAAGAVLATNRYNSTYNRNDQAQKISLDVSTNVVFMAGQIETAPNTYSYMLTKWSVKTVYAPINPNPLALLGFQENKGQLLTDSTSNDNIRFYCNNSFPEVFLNDSLMSMVLRVKGDSIDSLQRIDMRFTKGNMYNRLYPTNAQQLFANYYLGYCDKIEKNYYYNDILKPSAYTNTDVMFQNGADGYAYWFVCRPGSTPTDIEMEYEGQNSLSVDANGRLHIVTAFGDIVQDKPTAYTMNLTTGVLTTLPWQPTYQINSGNKVSFNYGTWSGTLVIRVSMASSAALSYCATLNNLDWSTYFGYAPGGNEASLDIYTKNDATTYITGIAMGADFPTQPGQFGEIDDLYNLGDGFVSCFNSLAELVWSTYVGGNKADEGRAIEYNSSATDYRIYAAGNTYSNSAFSWAQTDEDDFFMQSNVDGWVQDGWIMRFDENYGTAQWGTYIGSPEEDQAIDLVALNNGHVLLIGNTRAEAISSAGCEPNSIDNLFPICADGGEYLDGSNDGNWDVFITKFGTNNAILWSTFYGNNDHQKAFEATGFGSSGTPGFVWIVGRGDVDGYQSGTTESFLQNGTSNTAFILKFSGEGDLTWSTGLTGISGLQSVAMIKPVEQNSRLVVAGYTMDQAPDVELSCDAIPGKISICTPGGAYQDAVTENRDVYIAEFDKNSNELLWSTFYGTETNECIEVYEDDLAGNWPSLEYNYEKFMDITGDSRGYIYLTGTTSQEGNINHLFPLFEQTGWFQENYCDDGGYDGDAFILGFAANRELFWATFFEGLFADVEGLTIPYHSGCLTQLDAVSDQYLYFTGMSPNAYIPLACPSTPNPYCQEDQSSSFSSAIIGRFNIEQDAVLSDKTSFGDQDLIMSAYPVPASDKFTLLLATKEPIRLRLFNSLGALVKELSVFPNVSKVEIDMRELADDIYLLEALNEHGIPRGHIKIIKAQ
jgi:hypothetical protein